MKPAIERSPWIPCRSMWRLFYNDYDQLRTTEPQSPALELDPAPPHLIIPSLMGNQMDGAYLWPRGGSRLAGFKLLAASRLLQLLASLIWR